MTEIVRRGRPAKFRNAADKQKAYRERKKQACAELEALRKAEWENSPEGLKAKEIEIGNQREKHVEKLQTMHRWSKDIDADYKVWLEEDRKLLDAWWAAREKWYQVWKAAGYPK